MSLSLGTLYQAIANGVLGDAEAAEQARPVIGLDMLSRFLPYRIYEPATRLYLNARSTGFILNVAPLVGADEKTGELIGQFFSEGLPSGAGVQIVHWASPRIGRNIAPWFAPRYAPGGVYEASARRRTDAFYDLVWSSGSATAPFHARHHQLLVSVGMPASSGVSREELIAVRENLTGVLRSLDVPTTDVDPVELITFLDDLTAPTTASGDDRIDYNPLDPIADQAIRRDIELHVDENRLRLRTERFRPTGRIEDGAPEIGEIYPDSFDIRHFGVRNMPQRWAPWDTARLIGDLFTDKLRFPCPAATYLCLVYPDQESASARAGMKFLRATSLAYQGVPREQRMMIAGHLPSDTTSKYEHLTPDYLSDAMGAIDRYFEALGNSTSGHLRSGSVTPLRSTPACLPLPHLVAANDDDRTG